MEEHIPVMVNEAVDMLGIKEDGVYIDATFGKGGYTREMLKRGAGLVLGIDVDPYVNKYAEEIADEYQDRFKFHNINFADMETITEGPIDGIVFDLGVSTMQILSKDRGFSFSSDSYLDMRMSESGRTAAQIIAEMSENEIADMLYYNADERRSRKIANAIVNIRRKKPIETTYELRSIIHFCIGARSGGVDSATRSFQAIRIEVNQEMSSLKAALPAAAKLMNKEAVISVVSFHSTEDRIIKQYFKQLGTEGFSLLNKKVIIPSDDEVLHNPKSRSAKLRAIKKN